MSVVNLTYGQQSLQKVILYPNTPNVIINSFPQDFFVIYNTVAYMNLML